MGSLLGTHGPQSPGVGASLTLTLTHSARGWRVLPRSGSFHTEKHLSPFLTTCTLRTAALWGCLQRWWAAGVPGTGQDAVAAQSPVTPPPL